MNPLDAYVARQLANRVRSRAVVVWYDPRGEFAPFVDGVRGGPRTSSAPVPVAIDGLSAYLVEDAGSMFELRAAVEPLVGKDTPDPVVLYVPGREHDRRGSALMELEKGGDTWEPQLAHLARQVLREKYTLGQIDEMLPAGRKLTYADLARLSAGAAGAEPPSVLRAIFPEPGPGGIPAAWLASDARDGDVVAKAAVDELRKLVRSQIALELPADADLAKMRAHVLRYVLAGEFRSDLACPPPASIDSIPRPPGKDGEAAVRKLALALRTGAPGAYEGLADRVEKELGLTASSVPASALGAIDTFRFEERALLQHCGELVATGQLDEALRIVGEREHSFWLDRAVARKAQWEACRRMAELGMQARRVRSALAEAGAMPGPAAWVEAYTGKDGWYRLDQAQRRLEAWIATLDDHPDERPLGIVRRAYEDACHLLAEGFTRALEKGQWSTTGVLHQTRVHDEVVASRPRPVAYVLVDAMRFEMGVELAERLPRTSEVTVRPAIGALPSITAVGMAALQPGAATSFTIAEEKTKGDRSTFGARIDGNFLKDVGARKKLAAARIPQMVDIALNDLLGLTPSRLKQRIAGAQVIMVRSQEIDDAGEGGFTFQARQVMDTVIDNIARALRKLAAEGVEHAVIAADHGHLFFANDRDDAMKTDAPGGDTVDLHRRCWIGRGGKTPPGCVRVAASALGYDSDLDLIFPVGAGVFKAGGDLAFHHGGPTLQEMVIPVLTVRTPTRESLRPAAADSTIAITDVPDAVTTRTLSVVLTHGGKQMLLGAEARVVRPLLVHEGRQVGVMGLAVGGEYDTDSGCVTLQPNKPVSVAFILHDDGVPAVRVVVQDPATDAELARSPRDIPVRLSH